MSTSASKSVRKSFKVPSFITIKKIPSSLSLNPGNASKDDTPSLDSISPSNISHSSSRKAAGASVSIPTKAKKRSSRKNKENEFEGISITANGTDKAEGAISKETSSASTSSSEETQSQTSVLSESNKTKVLPAEKVKSQLSGRNKVKKELFPDSNKSKSSDDVPLKSKSTPVKPLSSVNSTGSVAPVKVLKFVSPIDRVTPRRGVGRKVPNEKVALTLESTSNTGNTKSVPTFCDNFDPSVELEFLSAGPKKEESLLKEVSCASGTKQNARTSKMAPIVIEVSARDELRRKISEVVSQNEPIAKLFPQSFDIDTVGSETNFDSCNSSAPLCEDTNLSGSETIAQLEVNDVASCLTVATENPIGDTSSECTTSEESGKKLKSIAKPVLKKPTNAKSVKTNKRKDVPVVSKNENSTGNEAKNGKTGQVKAKAAVRRDSNSTNRKPQVKKKESANENQNLSMAENIDPKCIGTDSVNKSPVKELTTIMESTVEKLKDVSCHDSQVQVSSRAFSRASESSRKRAARKITPSETPSSKNLRKGGKRAKLDDDIPQSQIVTLAVSKAGTTEPIPKYVENHKLTQEEKIQALHKFRNVGVWIQCCNSRCAKWRYVDEIKDPADVPRLWYCKMNPDPEHNHCSKPEQVIPTQVDDVIETSFTAGSLVWAKVPGYPFWPAMVEDDPELEQFYWFDECDRQKVTNYHVTFFDSKNVTRAWVPTAAVKPFTELDGSSKKRVSKYTAKINAAKNIALEALKMDNAERLAKFSFIVRYSGAIEKKKTGLFVPGGMYDSSDSESEPESQNSIQKPQILSEITNDYSEPNVEKF